MGNGRFWPNPGREPFGSTFLPFGDGLQDDNFDPNFGPAPFHFNLKRDGLQDDNFDPNFDPATSHFNLKRDGLQDDNFDPNFDPAPSHFNLGSAGRFWPNPAPGALAGSLLEATFCHLAAPRPAIEFLLGSLGNGRFWPNPGREPFGSNFCHLAATAGY